MKLINFLKLEFLSFGKYERILFPLVLLVTVIVSIIMKDNIVALVSAICGMSYTILAGKGRISCYFIGMTGTFCYAYIAFINGFYGQCALSLLYYLPMEIIGILKWRKYLKADTKEVIKTRLSNKDRKIWLCVVLLSGLLLTLGLIHIEDASPAVDGFTTVISIAGQVLTVKRCVEQWYAWFFVNLMSLSMWIFAYIEGSNCFATIIMWAVYLVLTIYFLNKWNKDLILSVRK